VLFFVLNELTERNFLLKFKVLVMFQSQLFKGLYLNMTQIKFRFMIFFVRDDLEFNVKITISKIINDAYYF